MTAPENPTGGVALVTGAASASSEEIVIIRPSPLSSIPGSTAATALRVPPRCTASIRRHTSTPISDTGIIS
jgi:hypothetical protein